MAAGGKPDRRTSGPGASEHVELAARPERSVRPARPVRPERSVSGTYGRPDSSLPPTALRPVIERVRPQVDCGRRPAKAAVGDTVVVEADAYADGKDLVACELRYAHESRAEWSVLPMTPVGQDRWRAAFVPEVLGRYRYAVHARIDRFGTWARDLRAWADAGEDVSSELLVGAALLDRLAGAGSGPDRHLLTDLAAALRTTKRGLEGAAPGGLAAFLGQDAETVAPTLADVVFSPRLAELISTARSPEPAVASDTFELAVDPAKARFSTWYELFPRSASGRADRHGTFADVVERIPYVAALGFDVLYLPPIHPIGTTNRKGTNGERRAGPDDPGSPWAIGSSEGGHRAVHPALGTLEQFDALVAAAAGAGIDVAIDLAFQASPDHPWVREHPTWFRHRPDGTIRYAENPPKRYEDIYPLDFETEDWRALWQELLDVVRFWIGHGVHVFRVDNPHTKPFRFWEWLIGSVQADHPGTIFLAEAFTRPTVMGHLAKIGFTQSYTYFTWKTTKWEIETYLEELVGTDASAYLRPNFWTNTPDILAEPLQTGGTPAFVTRLVLAATLAASYGIYGPAFELQEHTARQPGSEEYEASEKYQLRAWDLDRPDSLAALVARVNRIRREHRSLQHNDTLRFHRIDNDAITVYSKTDGGLGGDGPGSADRPTDAMVVVVNLDPFHVQSGWVELDLDALGVDGDRPYVMHDLLTDARYQWQGRRNFVILDPAQVPVHVLAVDAQPAPPSPLSPAGTGGGVAG